MNLGYKFTIGKKVIVIGGGNVAMDVARSAAREVLRSTRAASKTSSPRQRTLRRSRLTKWWTSRCRPCAWARGKSTWSVWRTAHEMPAALEEIEEAEDEGIIMHPGFGPKRIIGKDGKVVGLEMLQDKVRVRRQPAFQSRLLRKQRDPDRVRHRSSWPSGRRRSLDFLTPEDGVEISPRGLIAVNPQTLMTSARRAFLPGGDCVFGPRLIIDSVGDGKRAAVGIDEYLRGGKHPEPDIEVEVLERHACPRSTSNLSGNPFRCFLSTAAPA